MITRQLFSSKDHKCGEEILTIAAMVAVQVKYTVSVEEVNTDLGSRMFSLFQMVRPVRSRNWNVGSSRLRRV